MQLLHVSARQGGDQAAVQPAGEEGAHRHVAHQPLHDGLLQRLAQPRGRRGLIRLAGLGKAQRVVAAKAGVRVVTDARGKFGNLVHDSGQRLLLRGKDEGARPVAIVEGLDADGITRQKQRAAVRDGEGEHAVKPLRRPGAMLRVKMQRRLAVAPGLKGVPRRKLLAQSREVVELPVGHDGPPAPVIDGLVASDGVHDGKTAVAERTVPDGVHPLRVRPAMGQAFHHLPHQRVVVFAPDARYAAHGRSLGRCCAMQPIAFPAMREARLDPFMAAPRSCACPACGAARPARRTRTAAAACRADR